MKSVVVSVVALTFAVCSLAVAADTSSQTSKNTNAKTWKNAKTWNTSDTSNNAKTPSNTNTSNKSMTSKNTKSTHHTDTWNIATLSASTNMPATEATRVSYEGFAAIRAVRAARVAIFNGEPKVALNWLTKAQTELAVATKDAPLFVATTEATVDGKVVAGEVTVSKENWVPIDTQIGLSDTYVASPKNAEHIKNANEHFKNGHAKEALEELRLASIDVRCTRAMMSLTNTTNCVAEAVKLIGEQKYYEANLVLKTAEDGVVMESTNVFATPKTKNEKAKVID
jgi:hypothetical protein